MQHIMVTEWLRKWPLLLACRALLDLSILMDASGSIGDSNWYLAKDFIKSVVGILESVGEDQYVSTFWYSSHGYKVVWLSSLISILSGHTGQLLLMVRNTLLEMALYQHCKGCDYNCKTHPSHSFRKIILKEWKVILLLCVHLFHDLNIMLYFFKILTDSVPLCETFASG